MLLSAQIQLSWKKLDPTKPPGFPYSPRYAVGPNNLVWMAFSDGAVPFKVATGESFSVSTDGGNTWNTKGYFPFNLVSNDPNNFTLRGFSPLSSSTALYLWAVNNTGMVFKTKDNGQTWQKTSEFDTHPHSMHFFDDKNGVVICREGSSSKFKIYRTSNGGDSWQGVDPGNIPPVLSNMETTIMEYGYFSGTKNSYWFGTYGGRIFKTKDKGVTWSAIQSPYTMATVGGASNTLGRFAVDDIDADTAYLLEYHTGKLHKTTDGGTTWTHIGKTETGNSNFHIVKIPNTDVLLAGGETTRYSIDKGLTWTKIDDDSKFDPISSGPSCTLGGMTTSQFNVYKLIGIVDKGPIDPGTGTTTPGGKDDEDEFAIYPIPTGDFLYIRSKILIDDYIIWDSAGRLIQQGTTPDNRINVAWFSEGVYHIEIHHNGNTIVKKFIKE